MALVLPGSSTVVRSVGDVVHWSLSTVAFAVTLPTRLEALLFSVERLVARINQIADNADRVVIGAAAVTVRAETLVEAVEQTSDIAGQLLEIYEPSPYSSRRWPPGSPTTFPRQRSAPRSS